MELKDEKSKWYIISKGKILRENEKYNGVFIAPDLTENERKVELNLKKDLSNLRDESAKNEVGRSWTIKKGKIIEKIM